MGSSRWPNADIGAMVESLAVGIVKRFEVVWILRDEPLIALLL
jgi:hypothetical protein